jgi:hypothetical protein
MPRYRNEAGSIVSVDEELAERIGQNWKPLDKPESVKRSPGRPKKADE